MARRSFATPSQWLQIGATIVFATALTVLLIVGIRRAQQLQSSSSALQLASELSSRPAILQAELTLIQRELETTSYVGESLRNVAALRESGNQSFSLMQADLRGAGLAGDPNVAAPLAAALKSWQSLDLELRSLTGQNRNDLYSDTASGSELTASGKQLKATVDRMLAVQAQNLKLASDSLSKLSAGLRTAVADAGRNLRTLLLGGAAIAALLLALMLYYAWRSRLAAAAAETAQRQVANILGTVREGLFLIGRDMRLGETYSASLSELLRLPAPSGRSFEDVMRPLVDEKTLRGALKFIGLLWKGRVHEELIESVNPLSQIEVSFSNAHGGGDTRFLAFSFRRVRGAEASGDYILGAVSDITDRVLLGRELEHLKADSDSLAALLLQLLRLDPAQLESFVTSADVAFRKSNSMLTQPGIDQQELRGKLDGVFRELHAVKGEAAALALSSFAERIHAIEDTLSGLRAKTTLSGNDFLPVVVKLDDLMSHLATIQSLQERVAAYRAPIARPTRATGSVVDEHRNTITLSETATFRVPSLPGVTHATNPLTDLFRSLAQEVGRVQARSVRVLTRGLDEVPADFTGAVKDICVQMIRNAVVHGIESPQQRAQHGKPEEGTVLISFAGDSPDNYLLIIEDDGRGLEYDRIIDKALNQGLLRQEQVAALDRASVYRLIFQPGFTTVDEISEHAGRGVGLDAVGTLVRKYAGRIGVATLTGQYTRFKILLPKAGAVPAAASSAA